LLTPFHTLHDYMALPRLTGLRLSPDGSWLAASVSALSPDGRTFKPSIWRIPADPGQTRPVESANPTYVGLAGRAARLTRSAEGEDNPAFLPDGSLVFLSARPALPEGPASAAEPGAGQPGTGPVCAAPADGTAGKRALWLLPADGGEACQLTAPPGGISRLTEIATTASDGAVLRAWLVLPAAAGPEAPAPLLLWVHGGPLSSWNTWSWRWNPWLMAARGYAVLLPDPALSTGYGLDFIARGHAEWGDRPFTDLMAITDAALARPDIDETRTAMMGGSFGGYMANWIAGHTDRFRAIVSHASLWALDQMFGTTDSPALWRRLFGTPQSHPERYSANSPHLHAAGITTPMLIIHGDRDYRVPIGEALRMWADLAGGPSGQAGAKFLYFPDENHWVLTPGNATIWYETVFAFLAQHVLGQPWHRPALL